MTGFGSDLRTERERHGLSLTQLCELTKVPVHQLQSLEDERFAELPAGVFRRGIVRAYLAALSLDPNDWLPRFQAAHDRAVGPAAEPTAETWAEFAENVRRGRAHGRNSTSLRWVGVVLLLLVVAALAYALYRYVLLPQLHSQ